MEMMHLHCSNKEIDNNFFLISDLGFAASCDGEIDGTTKAVDFEMPYLPEGTTKEQYFVVCVFESTPADIKKRKSQRAPEWFLPSGPLVPRLLGCPDGSSFSSGSGGCAGADGPLYEALDYGSDYSEQSLEGDYQAETFK